MTKRSETLRRLTVCSVFAALLSVAAPLTIPAGPIPITLAIFFLFLCGGLLGPVDGLITLTVYVALGTVGVPVFSGFQGGYSVLIGPTGGFLLGYFPCVLFAGLGRNRSRLRPLFFLLGLLSCYLFGAAWFGLATGNDPLSVLKLAVLPFLLPDAGKLIAACLLIPPLQLALARLGYPGKKTGKICPRVWTGTKLYAIIHLLIRTIKETPK